jgi:3-oxoacyl-[acyl-carrier protein] reductase
MRDLEGKVAVVTGASSGIGLATAQAMVAAGARVAIFARNGARLREIAADASDVMLAVEGDISNEADVERLFFEVEERFGSCEVLVNNAGSIDPVTLVEMTPDRWDRMFAVNVRGVYLATRRALPRMIEQRSGTIVNVASISGVVGTQKFPGFVSYAAAKAAVIGMTEALAAEVREYDIRVNAVSPGSVDTEMLQRAAPGAIPSMDVDEVATTIMFLASDRSRPINGQNLHVFSA